MNQNTVFLLFSIIFSANCLVINSPSDTGSSHKHVIYQASVENTSNRHICNGVIITENWILTLAQCVMDYNASELKIYYGSNRLNNDGMYVNVNRIEMNPGFNKTIIKSDMALLLTANKIEFIENVSGPINLPEEDVPVNRVLKTTGWRIPAKTDDLMKKCNAVVMTLDDCKESYPSLSYMLRPWLLCSFEPTHHENNCAGVLGSSLVTDDNVLYGIMSMNNDTIVNKSLNIYTNVFDQISWIRLMIYGLP